MVDRLETLISLPAAPKTEEPISVLSSGTRWAAENVINPFVNTLAIDTWNGLSGTASDIAGNKVNPVKVQSLAVGDQSSWLNFGTQTVFSTAGMIVKFGLAAKGASVLMRSGGSALQLEGAAARLARNDSLAAFNGAVALTAAEKPREGESRLGNVTAAAFGMGVFQGAAIFSKGMSGASQFAVRFGTGSIAGGGQEVISAGLGGREITAENVQKSMLTGGIMGVGLPKVMELGTGLANKINLSTGRGVHVDRYIDANFSNASTVSPTLRALAAENGWARVQDKALVSAASVESKRITLASGENTPQKLAHELQALSGARNAVFEQQYKQVAELVKTPGSEREAGRQFREIRLNQEIEQLRVEHNVANQLGVRARPFNEATLRATLGEKQAFAGTTYDKLWLAEFDQFKSSGGTFRPRTEYGGIENKSGADGSERALAERAVRILQEKGEISVFAGGAVRDEALNIKPKDYDIATSATPQQVKKAFEEKGITVFPKGEAFGVMAVVMEGKQFEIATLRRDGQYSDGRRPDSVQLGASLKEDASRRDLTINAMFKDPVTGRVYDFFGGKQDIENKVLRAVGDPVQRVVEDPARMLRLPRFKARFPGFTVDPETASAVRANAPRLSAVSPERIRDEFKGILLGKDPVQGLRFVMGSGLMRETIPEMISMRGLRGRQDPVWHPEGTAWTHTLMVVDQLKGSSFERMMSGFMHDIGKPATQKIWPDGRISNHAHDAVGAEITQTVMRRLKFTNSEITQVSDAVRLHMQMHAVGEMGKGKVARLLERNDIHDLIALQHADSMATTSPTRGAKSQRDFLLQKLEELKYTDPPQRLGAPPLLNGQELIGMGYRPGGAFSYILDAARSAQYEGAITTTAHARRFITDNFAEYKGLTHQQQMELLRSRNLAPELTPLSSRQ